jgi:hypothetical protein
VGLHLFFRKFKHACFYAFRERERYQMAETTGSGSASGASSTRASRLAWFFGFYCSSSPDAKDRGQDAGIAAGHAG